MIKKLAPVILVVLIGALAQSQGHSAAFVSMQRKLAYIEQNGDSQQPDPRPIEISAAEANAYFAEGGVRLPLGVKSVRVQSVRAVITGTARVDFDQVTAGRGSANPLMSLFSGVHDVRVVAQATASGGIGSVRVQDVFIDDVKVPRMALQYFVEHYVRTRYPYVSLNMQFRMPARIDMAIVGTNRVTITQR